MVGDMAPTVAGGRSVRGRRASMRWIAIVAVLLLGGCSLPRWPADGPLTSPFGLRRNGMEFRIHHGVDIGLPDGTPVRAMAAGRVVRAGWMNGYGYMVLIDHGSGVVTLYAHLSEVHVKAGEEVKGQQVIALSGRSGNVTGPHLHFEVWRGGRAEDPVPLLGGPPRSGRR